MKSNLKTWKSLLMDWRKKMTKIIVVFFLSKWTINLILKNNVLVKIEGLEKDLNS